MGLNGLIDEYLDRRYGPLGQPAGYQLTSARTPSSLENAAAQLVRWIPVEILAFYVPAVDIASGHTMLWVVYGIALLMTPAFVIVQACEKFKKRRKTGENFKFPTFLVIAAFIAFAVWASALPGSIVIQNGVPAQATIAAVLLATVLLSLVDRFLKSRV